MSDASDAIPLLLIGVGGGGCHFAAAAMTRFGPGVQAVGFDMDAMTPRAVGAIRCKLLGGARYSGCSAGGDIVKGRTAVQDDIDIVRNETYKARLAVVVTSLGGGFGSGATPEILRILHSLGITTLCLATLPFGFEGKERCSVASRAVPILEEHADALAVLRLDDLYAPEASESLSDAIPKAEARLGDALMLFWSLLMTPGYISISSEEVIGLIRQCGGRCRFAVASAKGEARAMEAVSLLGRSPMLGADAPVDHVQCALLGVLAGADLRLSELGDISARFATMLPSSCEFRLATVLDERFAGSVQLVALLFDVMRATELPPPVEGIVPAVPSSDFKPGRKPHKPTSKLGRSGSGIDYFSAVGHTILNGENLDEPTYRRKGIVLDR